MKTGSASASKADISDGSTSLKPKANTGKRVSKTSSTSGMTATTQNASPKTLTSAELQRLRSKIGLVVGSLADWQTAGGLVAVMDEVVNLPSGRVIHAVRIYLVADGAQLSRSKSVDGVEIDLVADTQ